MKANWILLPVLIVQGLLIRSTHSKYINTPCEAHSDCGLNNHLQCINNFCQCDSNSQIYDQSTQKCLLLAGQQCQLQHDDQYNRQHSIPIKCVPHSDCTNSECRCNAGYRFSPDFLCKPDYGSPCHSSDDCDETLGLVCSNQGICDCYNVTLTWQGQFGCVDPKDPTFNEMLRLLNQTEYLLKENGLELKDMFNDLGLQNDGDSSGEEMSTELRNILASERQFHDTYNTNDLQFAAQNDAPAQQGGGGGGGGGTGLNFQQLLTLFQTFQSLIPRNMNNGGGGGGGGFFRNLFGGGNNNNNQGGYAESSSPAPASGYGPPGQPEMGMGMRMGLLARFLDVFNRMIPIVRELRMRFMPLRFFRNLLNRFSPSTTAAPPPAQSIINPSPEVIQTNGNYRQNPIFGQPLQEAAPNQGGGGGGGGLRFFMRARERFRNFLRGNNQGGQGGYPAAKPASSYGAPAEAPPPAEGAEPAGGPPPGNNGGGDSPPPPAPASSSNHNTYLNNHRQPPSTTPHRSHHNQFQGQPTQAQYNTIQIGGHQAIPPTYSGGSLPSSSTYNSGQHPNHDSFFDGQSPQQPNNSPSFDNQPNNNQYNAQAQATSHHLQSTFVAHHQKTRNQPGPPPPQPPQNHHHHNPNSNSNTHPRPPFPSIGSGTPPPIPQVKLQIPHHPSTKIPNLSDNFILSEADDPHPGFTPHSTLAPPLQESYRTSARFERIGLNEQHQATRIAQNWRETF